MANINFHGDVNVQGDQNVAGQDIIMSAGSRRAEMIEVLTDLLGTIREALAAGMLAQGPGDQATGELAAAIGALAGPDADAPHRARLSLAKAKEILTTVALVPALADAIAKAVEAVRGLC